MELTGHTVQFVTAKGGYRFPKEKKEKRCLTSKSEEHSSCRGLLTEELSQSAKRGGMAFHQKRE